MTDDNEVVYEKCYICGENANVYCFIDSKPICAKHTRLFGYPMVFICRDVHEDELKKSFQECWK